MQSSQEVLVDVTHLVTRVMVRKSEHSEPLSGEIRGMGVVRYPHVKMLHEGFPDVVATLMHCEVRVQIAPDSTDGHVECFMSYYVEEYERFPAGARITVSVLVSQDIFDALRDSLAGSRSKCTLYFQLPDWENKLTNEHDYSTVRATDASLELASSARLVDTVRLDDEDSRYYKAICEKVITKRWTLRYSIGAELSAELNKQDLTDSRWNAVDTLNEIMGHLVSSFHSMERDIAEGIPEHLFRYSPSEFQAKISELPKALADKLTASYDQVWLHVPIMQVVRTGEAASQLNAQRLVANVAEIEELARLYCEHRQLRSPRLEWAIINALVYSETISFARVLLGQTDVFGIQLAVPLEPVGHWKGVRKSLAENAWKLVNEAIVLAITAGAASLADAVSGSGFWPIFWGITAVRWIRKKDDPQIAIRAKNHALLTDMASAHQCLNTYDFNADLLKARLHALELRGAVFSVAVYNVLEKRLTSDRSH